MAYYFISDLHLDKSRPETVEAFIGFLHNMQKDAQALYILGDFVEYWVGDDNNEHGLDHAFQALKTFTKNCPVYLMHGNRDFLIGTRFVSQYNITLIDDPYIIEINQHKIILLHGDTLCTDDQDYIAFRQEVRSAEWQASFLSQPLSSRIKTAEELRVKSQNAMKTKSDDLMDVNQQAVEDCFADHQCATLIHGHTHRAAIHNHIRAEQHYQRIVLSDWHGKASYLKIHADEAELVTNQFIKTTTLID